MNDRVVNAIKQICSLLADRNYAGIAVLTGEVRLTETMIKSAVEEYGRIIIVPPHQTFDDLDFTPIEGQRFATWSIRVPLWTKEEGRSDLTLELRIADLGSALRVEVDDLHVL